jgi:hypothetical protein
MHLPVVEALLIAIDLSEKEHILIDTGRDDRQIVLPIPSQSAGPP